MMISCQICGHWYDDSFMNCPKCKTPQFSAEESESFYVPPPPPEISAMGEHLSHHTLTPSDSGHVNTAGFTAAENGQTSDPAQMQHRSLRSVSASGTKKSKAPVIALVTVLVILVLVVTALIVGVTSLLRFIFGAFAEQQESSVQASSVHITDGSDTFAADFFV